LLIPTVVGQDTDQGTGRHEGECKESARSVKGATKDQPKKGLGDTWYNKRISLGRMQNWQFTETIEVGEIPGTCLLHTL
jgi:hypothetical protein